MKERILARIMVLILAVSMIPYQTFAADPAETKTVKSIEDIRTKYEVDYGTTLDKIGLPSSLSAVIETTRLSDGNTDEEPESTEETVQEDIRWEGKYDGNSAGKYKLEARFEDKDLVYKDMPVVTVTVREPESEPEDEPVQSEPEDKPDQSENQDEPDQSENEDEPDQSENQDEAGQSEKENEQDQSRYVDKADQPEEEEKADQSEEKEKTDEPEDKAAQSEKEEKANQSKEKDKADEPEKEDKAAQSENADEAGQSRSTDEEDKPETEAVKDIEQNADSNVRMKKTEKRFADVPVDEPFTDEPVDEPSGDSNSFTTPEEQAEIYYGENGTARTFTVTLTDDKHFTAPNDVTCAGGNIGYNINVNFYSAARYKYDGSESAYMFSKWENIKIYLKLPENVRFTDIKTQGVADHFTQIDSENNLWEIVLTRDYRDATNNNSIYLDINTRIEGNGELPDGTVLGEAEVTLSADFDVRINEDGTVKQYSKTVLDSTDKIILSTPDEWTLTKSSLVPNSYTIDENTDPASVTVHYLIQYGLDVNGVPADDDNVYKSPGRVPFKNDIKLTDTPTLTLQNGTKLVETSMTVTPVRTGYVYKDGSSADEGGKPRAITAQRDTETVLPYAVVGSNTKGVAESAPAYSEYNVDVVYPYDEFEVWYFENVSEDDARAKAENKAKIRYQLAGQDTGKDTPESSAETTVSGYIPPANIKIEKYIVDYDSDSKNLYTAAKGFVTGPATFEVYESDGTKPAVLWYKDASDNNKFKKIPSGNIVTVDPAQAKSASNGNEGWIDFYLDAGTYVIKETGRPAYTDAQGSAEKTITVNEDGTATASFDNKERLGEVKVHKTDDSNNTLPLPGAVFGLYTDRHHTQPVKDAAGNAITATTNKSGDASFKRLLPGTYYLWEISAPKDYIKSEEVKEVTVTANNTSDAAVQVTNHLNEEEISLLKQYSTVADPNNFKDVTDDYRKFANAFVLQRCSALDEAGTNWSEWEDVSTHSIDSKGGTTVTVAEYDSQNRKLKYRFMETIPSDYFDLDGNPGNGSNKAYSDEIIPADGTPLAPQNKIVMKNRKGGFIELTKKKVELNVVSGKYTEAAGGDKEFRLYRVAAGNNIAEAVDTGTTDANGKLTFSGLVSADARGRIYTYYVVEQNPDTGYTWITDSKITIGGAETDALSVGSFTAQSGGTLTPVTYNVKQEIRLGVIKKDRFSDSTQLAGAKFEISDESGKKQTVTTKNSGAVYAKIDLGHVYTITETEAPAEHYNDAQPQTIDTSDWRVVMEGENFKILKGDDTEVKAEDLVFTFKDTPYPYVTVNVVKKYYNARDYELTGLKYELEGAEIALYQNNGDGTYTYVTTGMTDKMGQVSFSKILDSADGFAAIEVSVPDREEYKHMVPAEGDYLQKTDGSCPSILTQAEVDTLSKTVLTSETDPKYTGEIDNVLPWTQIHVRKCDEDNQSSLDGADFTLYKQVLPENKVGGELAFDAANCTVVGRYTSGTLIQNGRAKEGEFQTDILEIADNIVYWLVETRAPSGYAIKESENYVLFANKGTNYTNKSNDGKSTKVFKNGLQKNTINDYEAENEREISPEALNNRAYIVFTKWVQKEGTAGKQDLAWDDFMMMPNAEFELYAVNAYDHNKVCLLDTITTGDENQVEGGAASGYGVSRALDAWEIFDEIERRFPDQREHIITYKSAPDSGYDVDYPYVVGPDGRPIEDAAGNRTKIKGTFVLNAALVEKSCSSKYNLDLHDHNLQIMFIPSSLSLGNDKYEVADLENSSAGFCDAAEGIRDDYKENASASVAIVDYLANNNSVVLRHFGYDPKDPEVAGNELQYEELEALRSSSPSLFISRRVSFSLERYNEDSSRWEYWSPTANKKIDSAEYFTTEGNGYSFEEGLNPGEYRAVMTTLAAGYENLYSDVASAFHFTVAVSDKSQVFTTYSPAKPPRVRMIIDKEVDFGDVRARDYSFSFTLEDSKSNKMPAETGKDAATGTLKDDGTIEKTQAVFDDLTQGETYYLKENPKEGYLIKEVKVDGQTCTPEDGRYKIVIPEKDADVSVTVKNTLLESCVTIFKYDGATGKSLTGASFEVLKADGETVVSKAEVADNGDGSYTAVIPLESTDGKTYYIHEVRAPETDGKKYIIDEENASVKVEDLQPGQNIQYRFNGPEDPDNQYVLPNYVGVDVRLTKSADKDTVDSLLAKEAELTYTLAVNTENAPALDAFKFNDPGLRAEPSNATLSQEWYSINEVIVGQGKMDKYLKGATPDKDYAIFATVTFVGFDGTEYKENPVNVSEGNISVQPVSAGGEKIKSFYVEYSSPDLKIDTGYALGQNFKAGNTVVKATVFKQEKPEDGVVTAVKKIINNAEVTLTYTPGDSKGKKQKTQTLTAEDDAETVVDGAKAPKIKFSKTGPDQDVPVELGDSITYRLTVKNVTGEPLDFTDPIIVDLLPQGMVVKQDTKFVDVVDRPGTIANNPTVSTGYAGDSQYVNIIFDGTVADGESITVELTATVTNAVTNYGTVMRNFAFTTSKEVGVATSDNPTGAVIRDDHGDWASELVSIATALDCSNSRAQALKDALGEQGKYGYLADWHENNWVSDNQLVCVKAEYGPEDGGVYRTDKVSVIVNDEGDDNQRRMHYQLDINNLSPSKRTNLVVMDILPVVGDQRINNTGRGSNWPLYFETMGSVTVNGQTCTDYSVYYYSGDASQLTAGDIETLITKAKTECPDGWSSDQPEKATAFILAFNYDPTYVVDTYKDSRTVVLEGNKSIQIEYTALTDYREAEELNEIVFTNAANDFNFGFSTFSPPSTADKARSNEPLGSNQVEVTIAPPKVKVGGDVWIDADDNGWQDDGDQSWYLGFDIVKQLIDDLGVKIDISDQKNFSVSETRDGSFTETGSGPNYGIAHFEFDELTAAKLRNNSTDYANWNDGTAGKLIGKNPYTYFVDIAYKGSTFAKTVNKVDPRGSYVPGSIPENDQKDDNFEGSAASVRTEQFFLHQTKDVFDMTKDIGYNLKRKLELTKVSRVDGKPVEGAEFTIYGPFVHDTGKDQELSDSKIAAVLTTGANGKAEKTGLQFFMEYVIVETGAVKGFGIEGALAEGTNIQKLEDGKWLLKVPGFKAAVPEDTGYVDAVTVRDPENIEVEVEKIWNDEEGAYSDRPLSIEVMLYTDEECTAEAKDADGNTVEKKILNKINSWKAKWTDLPRYKVEKDSDGNETETEIVYYAKETLPAGKELKGYNVVIARDKETSSGKQSLTITNTPQTKGVKVQKVWAGELPSLDADERIVSVTFQVQRSVDPSDENSWENVVKKVKGVATDVTIVINRDETEARSVTGLPRNVPNGNAYSYRAVEIMMTVKDKDGATHDIDISGGAIGGYKVTEIHSAQEDGSDESEEDEDEPSEDEEFDTSTFTNTAVKGKLKPVKDWQDEGNRYGDRPTAIKIRIKAEGTDYFDYETIIELNAGNNWGEDLDPIEVPVMDVFGNKITYVITEILDDDKDKEAELLKKYVPTFEIETEGVEAKVTGEGVTGSTEITDGKTTTDTYTNTHKPVRTSVTAKKIWNDQNNRNGERPETIEFTLFETYTDSEGNEKTEAVAEDDTGKAVTPKEVKAAEDGTWTVSWSDLAVYKKGLVGSRITYSVRETKINGIDVNQYYGYNVDENGLEVTNTPVETGLDVTKEWEDEGAEAADDVTAATFQIERSVDGKTWSEMKQDGKTVTLTLERKADEVTGMGSVDGLPAYDMSSKPYMYRAAETSITVDGKTVEVKDGKVGFYEVTETHTPGKDESDEMAVARDLSEIRNSLITTDFSVEKQFEGDSFGISKSVKAAAVKLQRRTGKAKWEDLKNPADAGSYELTAKDDWAHTWKDLPAYDQNGNVYQYRAVEVSITVGDKTHKVSYGEDETSGTVTAYEYSSSTEVSEEDGFTTLIVNKLRTGSLEVSKIWKDANDKSRPGSVKVSLVSNAAGKKISLKGVKSAATLNKDNKWTDQKTWAELPVYDAAGNKIVYSLEEPEIKKYTAAYKIAVKGRKDQEGKGTKLSTEISAGQTVKASFTNTLNTSSSSSSVRTGDDTPLTALIVMFALSMAGLALVIWRRKRC